MNSSNKIIEKLDSFSGNTEHSFKRRLLSLFLIFIVGSMIGWVYEELYYLLDDHLLLNRGFMYGPWLPVYGIGTLLMLGLLFRFRGNPLLAFLGGAVVCGVLEYIAGAAVLHFLHERLWDYTGLFLNINGFVCLRSVITFGVGALLLFYLVQPVTNHFLSKMKDRQFFRFGYAVLIIFILDLVMSIIFRR